MGKVFVGGLSRETTTNGLRGYFERFGDISDCVVMKDRSTGAPRGFGFVTYASQTIADRVVLHRHVIDGKEVEAKPAVPRDSDALSTRGNEVSTAPQGTACSGSAMPSQSHPSATSGPPPSTAQGSSPPTSSSEYSSKKIFVGGLSHDTSEQDFIGYFSHFGQVVDCVIMCDPHTRKPRGFGFITYESVKSLDRVCSHKFHNLNGKRVEVKRAIPQERIAAEDAMVGAETGCMPHSYGQGRRGPGGTGGMYHPNAYLGGPGGLSVMPGTGGPVPGPGPMLKQMGMPPMNGLPGPTGGMFAGMVGVPNALSPSAWNMNMLPAALPNMMNPTSPRPPTQPASAGVSPALAPMSGDAAPASLPPLSADSHALTPISGGAPSPENNAGLDAALSTANSVLSHAAALAEPQPDGTHQPVALNANLRNAFANPKNNYGSASAALSAGLRAGYGLDDLTPQESPKSGAKESELPPEAPHLPAQQATEGASSSSMTDAAAEPPPVAQSQPISHAQSAVQQAPPVQAPTTAQAQGPTAQVADGSGTSVLTTGQLQQQLKALQQQQQLLERLQQQQIQLHIQQQKQQQQLQMQMQIQQKASDGEVQQAEDVSGMMMQMGVSESSHPASAGAPPELMPLPGFQMQGYSQLPLLQ